MRRRHGGREQCFSLGVGWSGYGTEQMNCATCGHSATRVVDSRTLGDVVRRRRCCVHCDTRFTTHERVHNPRVMVQKQNGTLESFSLEKLERSVALACAKRQLPVGAIKELAAGVHDHLTEDGKEVVASSMIGEMVLEMLKDLDRVAYIRFASVYRDFDDPERFVKEFEVLASDLTSTHHDQKHLLRPDALSRLRARA